MSKYDDTLSLINKRLSDYIGDTNYAVEVYSRTLAFFIMENYVNYANYCNSREEVECVQQILEDLCENFVETIVSDTSNNIKRMIYNRSLELINSSMNNNSDSEKFIKLLRQQKLYTIGHKKFWLDNLSESTLDNLMG
jgi:hypothetical protein